MEPPKHSPVPQLIRWSIRATLPRGNAGVEHTPFAFPEAVIENGNLSIRYRAVKARLSLDTREGNAEIVDSFPAFSTLLRSFLASYLPIQSGALMHAAAIKSRNGAGFLFPAASENGKTTLAKHCIEKAWPVTVLSDEVVPIKIIDGKIHLFGSPFWGDLESVRDPGMQQNNLSAPIQSVHFVKKGSANEIQDISEREALREFLAGALLRSPSHAMATGILEVAHRFSQVVPAQRWTWIDIDFLREQTARILGEKT